MVKSTFSFYNDDTLHKTLLIHDDLFLRMSQVDESIVEMYFVNNDGNRIDIPKELIVINNFTNKRVNRYSNTQTFALVWSENYTISMNNLCIVKITKEREWSIESDTELTNFSVF